MKSNRKSPSLAFLLITVFWSQTALAAAPRLVIPPGNLSVDLRSQIENLVSQEARLQLVEAAQIEKLTNQWSQQSDEKSAPAKSTTAAAEKLLAEGWRDFRNLKIELAVDKLERAKLRFRELAPTQIDQKQLLTAYLHLGIALLASGEKSRGQQEIREMLILDPKRATRQLNAKYYAPEYLETYEVLRKEVMQTATQRLEIVLSPLQAKVWVDGEAIQGTVVTDLPPGEHFIAAKFPTYRDYFNSKLIVVGENSLTIRLEENSNADLTTLFTPIRSPYDLPQTTVALLDKMSLQLGGDIYLFHHLVRNSAGEPLTLEAQLYDQRTQEITPTEKVSLVSPKKNAEVLKKMMKTLLSQIDSRGYVVSKNTQPPENIDLTIRQNEESPINPLTDVTSGPSLAPPHPWYKKPWVWGVVGGSVALILGGFLIFSGDSGSSTLLVDNPTQ